MNHRAAAPETRCCLTEASGWPQRPRRPAASHDMLALCRGRRAAVTALRQASALRSHGDTTASAPEGCIAGLGTATKPTFNQQEQAAATPAAQVRPHRCLPRQLQQTLRSGRAAQAGLRPAPASATVQRNRGGVPSSDGGPTAAPLPAAAGRLRFTSSSTSRCSSSCSTCSRRQMQGSRDRVAGRGRPPMRQRLIELLNAAATAAACLPAG